MTQTERLKIIILVGIAIVAMLTGAKAIGACAAKAERPIQAYISQGYNE